MSYANSRSNNSRMFKDDEQLRVVMKWTAEGCVCNEQLKVVDAMNSSGLWMQWTTQEEGHCTPKMGDRGLRLQVKPLKDDQDEDDQLTKKNDLNASMEWDAPYETKRKRVTLMKLKKMKRCHNWNWKDNKLRTKVQWTTLGCGCNEQHQVVMKWTTLRCGHCTPLKERSQSVTLSQTTKGWLRSGWSTH